METQLANSTYRVTVRYAGRQMHFHLCHAPTGFCLADGPYVYRAARACDEGSLRSEWLLDQMAAVEGETLRVRGHLAGLDLEHELSLPADQAFMEERIRLRNATAETIALQDLACGFLRLVSDPRGRLLPEVAADRFVAIPMRHQATDATDWDNDFPVDHFLTQSGREPRAVPIEEIKAWGYLPSEKHIAEGWAWTHGGHTFALWKFNQEAMEFSILATEVQLNGLALRYGGVGMVVDEPSVLRHIAPGQSITFGVTRYQAIPGGFTEACYAMRAYLDAQGCRFPRGYNPPVHWNELYDNEDWHLALAVPWDMRRRQTRSLTYTRPLIMQEAAKAQEYHCEALYLDPGWDDDHATFIWAEDRMGNRREFVRELRERYGLALSLHTPLAAWLSHDGQGVLGYPRESYRVDAEGRLVDPHRSEGPYFEGSVCLGSRQYLDEAERRLPANCADGVSFLMFDGNWWNGSCWDPNHGHPVPYAMEDHCRANLELARRVHAKYPHVLIEMHDMIMGGDYFRYTPLYYKHGLPGSYDENWGFELMWSCMDDLHGGRARSLYYYNLGCNIPLYTHVDLRDDNEHCLILWWFASTCRHLGIGGTHENPQIAQAHKLAMARYRRLDRFFKRGEFYGAGEEVHLHVLPEEQAFVASLFNLSDEERVISGTVALEAMGLERERWWVTPKGGRFDGSAGTFTISRRIPAWGAQVVEVHALAGPTRVAE